MCAIIYATCKCSAVIKCSVDVSVILIHLRILMLLSSAVLFKCLFLMFEIYEDVIFYQSGCILQYLKYDSACGFVSFTTFITQTFQFDESIFIRNLFHSRSAIALLIPT